MDTIDKIVDSYFAAVTKRSFTYKNKLYKSKPLSVSPLSVRGFTCPSNCGGCCSKVFSLDYLPSEQEPYHLKTKVVKFNNKTVLLKSDPQTDKKPPFCRNLDRDTGRCMIHGKHPFSCDFELLRFGISSILNGTNTLNQKLYGRGWAMLRIDGERGAKCGMTEVTDKTIDDSVRRMNRLKQWADYFGLDTWIPEITSWMAKTAKTAKAPLILGK